MESLLCGTPVVAFDVGGNRDLVEHLVNGYLAQPFNSMDLARGMEWVLENEERRMVLGRNGRRKIEYQFCTDRVAEQYIQLYEKALSA
jgi:glycosyltransferase involved in cell wall biosynthesis